MRRVSHVPIRRYAHVVSLGSYQQQLLFQPPLHSLLYDGPQNGNFALRLIKTLSGNDII